MSSFLSAMSSSSSFTPYLHYSLRPPPSLAIPSETIPMRISTHQMVSECVDPPTTMSEDDAIAESYIWMQGVLCGLTEQLRQMNARSATDLAEFKQAIAASWVCRPKDGRVTPRLRDELQVSSVEKQAEELPPDKSESIVVRYVDVLDHLPVNKLSLLPCAQPEGVEGMRFNITYECRKGGRDVDNDEPRKGEVVRVGSLSKEDGEARDSLEKLGASPPFVGMIVGDDDESKISADLGTGDDENKAAIVEAGAVYKTLELTESGLELVGDCTRSVPTGNWMSTRGLGKLQDIPLIIRSSGLDSNVLGVLDYNNDPSNQLKLLPCFPKVDDIESVVAALEDVALHLEVTESLRNDHRKIIIDPGGMLNTPIDFRSTLNPLDLAEEGGDAEDRLSPTQLSALDGHEVVSIIYGAEHTITLSESRSENIAGDGIACGDSHCLAVTMEGEVQSKGRNHNGLLGLGSIEDSLLPHNINTFQGVTVKMVDTGDEHYAKVTENGELYGWGWECHGNLGFGDRNDRWVPKRVAALHGEKIVVVACGWRDPISVPASGALYTFGCSKYGQFGHGNFEDHLVPHKLEDLQGSIISKVSSGWRHTMALTSLVKLYGWGWNKFGQVGVGDNIDHCAPVQVKFHDEQKVVQVSCGWWHILAITEQDNVFSWGRGTNGQLGHGESVDRNVSNIIDALSVDGSMGQQIQSSNVDLSRKIWVLASERYVVSKEIESGKSDSELLDGCHALYVGAMSMSIILEDKDKLWRGELIRGNLIQGDGPA